MQESRQDVTDTRQTLPTPMASLACGLNGHAFRVVTQGKAPIGLECSRCLKSWTVEQVAASPETADRPT